MAISEKKDALLEDSVGWAMLCASVSVLCNVVPLLLGEPNRDTLENGKAGRGLKTTPKNNLWKVAKV